ncbi:ABC transporter permease [Alistipes sp. cv1]|uniref:ABC transporter permease n=1 Tax=Alistipes sp. cv1 TaxID=1622071 RepID=UPI000C78FC05|nr:ABC transporter permease [Alistipes sp. cv1]
MKRLIYTFRYLTRNRGNNLIRILSMTLGLVVGAILLSQVAFDTSFDRFYPDADRIYQIYTHYAYNGEEDQDRAQVYPLLPAVRDEVAEIVSGTMFCNLGASPFHYRERQYTFPNMIFADSLFFDFFNVRLLQGDPTTGFASNGNIFISKSCAEKLFGGDDPVGQTIFYKKSDPCTVVGVFEDFPSNSEIAFDAVMPIGNAPERGYFIGWNGGSRYLNYVKINDGTDPVAIGAKIKKLYIQHAGEIDEDGETVTFVLYPITQIHLNNPKLKHQLYLKTLLALIILFVAAMNYTLASISSLSTRARTMAMHKCNGCTTSGVFRMMLGETGMLLFVSAGLAALLILAFHQPIQQIVVTPFNVLFTFENLSKSLIVVLILFLLADMVTARIYSGIPVAAAFRNYILNKRVWKQTLLFIQFAGTTLLIALLLIVIRQYNTLLNKDLGYEYKNLVCISFSESDPGKTALLKQRLGQIPEIESFCFSSGLPFRGMSGEAVIDDSTRLTLFHTRWMEIDPELIPAMEIEMKFGKNFTEFSTADQIIVNEEFVRQSRLTGNPVGKTVTGTGILNTPHTIAGITRNFYVNSLSESGAVMPIVLFPASTGNVLTIKFTELTRDNLSAVERKLQELLPGSDISPIVYREMIRAWYNDEVRLRNTVILGVIITLLIALIGLISYTKDEISRRSKEIAIRKVNGATAVEIIRLITRDLQVTTLLALITGLATAYWLGNGWLQRFAVKTPLSAWIFFVGGAAVCLIIATTITARTWRAANENPARSIKKE